MFAIPNYSLYFCLYYNLHQAMATDKPITNEWISRNTGINRMQIHYKYKYGAKAFTEEERKKIREAHKKVRDWLDSFENL